MNMYQVVDSTTKTVVAVGFAKREDARPTRNAMNAEAGSDKRYIISRGCDHPRGPSYGFVEATSRRWL